MGRRIILDVSQWEYEQAILAKKKKTWRQMFLRDSLGIDIEDRVIGRHKGASELRSREDAVARPKKPRCTACGGKMGVHNVERLGTDDRVGTTVLPSPAGIRTLEHNGTVIHATAYKYQKPVVVYDEPKVTVYRCRACGHKQDA